MVFAESNPFTIVAAFVESKLSKAAAGELAKALANTMSVTGVRFARPELAAKPYNVIAGVLPTTFKIQGAVWPPAEVRLKEPSAPVVPVRGAPEMHLAVTVPPIIAAPVAATPVRLKFGEVAVEPTVPAPVLLLPPPHPATLTINAIKTARFLFIHVPKLHLGSNQWRIISHSCLIALAETYRIFV